MTRSAGRKTILALDIGGTKIAVGRVDVMTSAVKDFQTWPTEAHKGGADVAERTAAIVKAHCSEAENQGENITGIAIGICEIVDRFGQLQSRSTIDWMGLELAEVLQTDLSVHLVSDVRAAALAEVRLGAAQGSEYMLYVSIGTGISSTLVIQGRPLAGSHGAALVLSSAVIENHCVSCGAVTHASLERVASGAGLAECYGAVPGIDAKEIVRRAEAGEGRAKSLLETATRFTGQAIAQLSNCTDPEIIVVGGGLGGAKGLYWNLLEPAINASLWRDAPAKPLIRQSSLGADRGVRGAALAALDRLH